MTRRKKLLSCIAVAGTLAACCLFGAANTNSLQDAPVTVLSDTAETNEAIEFVNNLTIGWNLGNTFDAPEGEMAWGNPMTTKELLQLVRDLGFDTIRIPTSWGRHVSAAPDYIIDEAFMNRIDTVVNDALDCGLTVILNSHHDNDIYMPKAGNSEHGQEYLTAIWTQIAEHFRDTDERLIFQTMNEPRVTGTSYEWYVDIKNPDSKAAAEVVNELNQAALNAIRATGGKNADRYVMICPYAGNVDAAILKVFQLPEDTAENRLIVSIHAYTPYGLCLNRNSKEADFTTLHEKEIKSFLKNLNHRFIKKGIPVIIDEMGCLNKDNPEGRYEWGKAYVAAAKAYGIPCVWWDNGQINSSGENFGLINRRKLALYEESKTAYDGLMEGLQAQEAE